MLLNLHCSPQVIYKIDIPANRYDMLCLEGIARALNIFLGREAPPAYRLADMTGGCCWAARLLALLATGAYATMASTRWPAGLKSCCWQTCCGRVGLLWLPAPLARMPLAHCPTACCLPATAGKPLQRMTVRAETALVRPFVVCAVLRGVRFDPLRYNSFIDLQVGWSVQSCCCCCCCLQGMLGQETCRLGDACNGFGPYMAVLPGCHSAQQSSAPRPADRRCPSYVRSPLLCRTSCTRTCAGSARWWPLARTTSPRSRQAGGRQQAAEMLWHRARHTSKC